MELKDIMLDPPANYQPISKHDLINQHHWQHIVLLINTAYHWLQMTLSPLEKTNLQSDSSWHVHPSTLTGFASPWPASTLFTKSDAAPQHTSIMMPDVSRVWIGIQHWKPPYSLNMGAGAAGSIWAQSALPWAMSVGMMPGVIVVAVVVDVLVDMLMDTLMETLVVVETDTEVVVMVDLQDAGHAAKISVSRVKQGDDCGAAAAITILEKSTTYGRYWSQWDYWLASRSWRIRRSLQYNRNTLWL